MWTERVVPRLVDLTLRGAEIDRLREGALQGLAGRVVELGFGSGLNVRWYPPAVVSVDAVEPSDLGWELSSARRSRSSIPIERVGLDGQAIEAPPARYDCAVCTFTLCTIPDPAAALRELRRVVRPGGTVHVVEHGLAPDADVVRRQRRWEPLQRRVAGGCHLTRDVVSLVRTSGLTVETEASDYLPGPRLSRPWTYVSVVRARV